MGQRKLAQELNSLINSLREHEEKRRRAESDGDDNLVRWYDKEIAEMERRISPLQDKVRRGIEECPNCGREVIPVSNLCPKCDTYMG